MILNLGNVANITRDSRVNTLVTLRMAGPKSRRRQRCVRPSGGWHRVGHLLSCPDYNSHLLPWYCDNDGIYSTLDISSPPVPSLPLGYGETTIIAFFLDFRITPGGKHVQDIPDGWTAFVYTLQVPVTFLISQDLQIWTLSTFTSFMVNRGVMLINSV